MPVNRIAIREGDRQARRQSARLGDELSELRRRSSLTQAAVARAIGTDRSLISRLERGDPRVGLGVRFRVAAVLGADLRLTAYPQSGTLIRDTAQARIVETVLGGLDRRWGPTVEATLPGERRSIDLLLVGPAGIVVCEVESRVGSLEEIIRELHAKRDAVRAGLQPGNERPVHAVLILPRTRHHLAIARAHPGTMRAAFPTPSGDVQAALADASRPWTGDGILWVPVPTAAPQGGSRTGP